MVTETYKYFIADTNLRSDYGGAVIQNYGDTLEPTKEALCLRHICNKLNVPFNYTQYLAHIGVATGSITYIRVPDAFYSAISSHLTASELASVVSSAPTGFALSITQPIMQPMATGKTIMVRGDSISAGIPMDVANGSTVVYSKVALDLLAGETSVIFEPVNGGTTRREFIATGWKLNNYAIGGSSWANTEVLAVSPSDEEAYPKREDLAFNQRTKTLPLNANASNIVFAYWLGTNDLGFGTGITGATVWARAVNRITAFKANFPNVRVIIGTVIKRAVNSSINGDPVLNVINHDYNVLLRNNFKRLGVSAIFDFEALVPEVNIITGDTTNTTYYIDYAHIKSATHALLAPIFRDAVNNAFAITLPINPVLAVPTPTSTTIPLSWTMSNDTNIIDYDICYQVSNSDNWITFSDGVSTAKTATLTGLTSGTSYDVMIKAVRSVASVVDTSFSNVITVTTA